MQVGAEGQNRTADTMIFSHVLYQTELPRHPVWNTNLECTAAAPGAQAEWRRPADYATLIP